MPTYLTWADDSHTILIQKYEGVCTLDDFHRTVDESNQALATVSHPVDLILDMTSMRISAKQLLSAASHAERKVPQNQRLLLVVGAPPFIKAIVKAASKIAPNATRNLHFLNTMAEAYTIIEKVSLVNGLNPSIK